MSSASKKSNRRFVITEKAPTRAFSWLKAATTAFTFNTLLRHYAEWVPKNSAKVITDECLNSVLNVCEGTSSLYRDCEIFTNIHLKLYPGPGPPSRCCTSSSSSSSAGSSWSPACRPRPARPPQCPRPAAARCPCGGGGGWSPSRVTCHTCPLAGHHVIAVSAPRGAPARCSA